MFLKTCLGIFALTGVAAFASNNESWVSVTGIDTNPCTLAQPCRTFSAAYTATAAGGIVRAMNAGDFGPLAISKSITVDGGGLAVIEGEANSLISITGASVVVTVRNLTLHTASNAEAITGAPAGGRILFIPPVINLDNITINATGTSLIAVSINATSGALVHMKNLSITGGAGAIYITAAAGSTSPVLVQLEGLDVRQSTGNGLGMIDCSGIVRDSVFDNNQGAGLSFDSTLPNVALAIDHTEMSFNGNYGLSAGNGTTRLSNSTITGNYAGIVNSGTVISFRNNWIAGNTVSDGAPSLATSLR